MKAGTKCRLKYRPLIEFIFSEIDSIDNKIGWIQYQNDAKHFPVPLSELEPIIEWPKAWEDLDLSSGWEIEADGGIYWVGGTIEKALFATKAQAESAFAFAQLSQLHKAIVGDWVADWSDTNQSKWAIYRFRMYSKDVLFIGEYSRDFYHLAFQTEEQAQFSLTHHRELWEKYWML